MITGVYYLLSWDFFFSISSVLLVPQRQGDFGLLVCRQFCRAWNSIWPTEAPIMSLNEQMNAGLVAESDIVPEKHLGRALFGLL